MCFIWGGRKARFWLLRVLWQVHMFLRRWLGVGWGGGFGRVKLTKPKTILSSWKKTEGAGRTAKRGRRLASSSEFLFPMVKPLEKNKKSSICFISTFISDSTGIQSHSSSSYPHQLLYFCFSSIFKLPGSKPGVIIDSVPRRAQTHTSPHSIQSSSPLLASCTLSLLLTVSCRSLLPPLQFRPSTPTRSPTAQSQEGRRLSGSNWPTSKGQV